MTATGKVLLMRERNEHIEATLMFLDYLMVFSPCFQPYYSYRKALGRVHGLMDG